MSRFLLSIFILPFFACGQSTYSPTTSELEKIYSQAITDFIKAANKKNKTSFDTLYFGKRTNGQPDDFPDIELPKTLEKTHIQLISTELGKIKQNELKSRIYINLIGWVNKEDAEFIFVVFSNGFEHQYDYEIHYSYNLKKKLYDLKKLQFKGSLPSK